MLTEDMNIEYCKCSNIKSVTAGFADELGFWDVCCTCGKRIEGGHHYYNHYDGKDHIEYWTLDGDIVADED